MSASKYKEAPSHAQKDDTNYDETDKPPHSCGVTYLDLGSLMYSFIFHFVDVGYDFYVAHSYYTTGKYSHFAWTIAFILLPSIIITLISIRMYVEDSKGKTDKRHFIVRIVLCVLGSAFQLALPIRYCDSFRYALRSLKAEHQTNKRDQEKYFLKMLNEDSDVALLRVYECYLESAPQLVLQMTLLVIDYIEGSSIHTTKQIVFICLGFAAMGWCMTNYHRCIRFDQEEKKNISALGIIIQFLWHLNLTVSRILTITALAALYTSWTLVAALIHWFGMTVWMSFLSKTNFCGKNNILKTFFYASTGVIYIFNFLNTKEGSTRNSFLFFYMLCFLENIIAVTIWGVKASLFIKNWIYYVFLILPILCFALSVGFLILYYQYLHPNKLKLNVTDKNSFFGDNNQVNSQVKLTVQVNSQDQKILTELSD